VHQAYRHWATLQAPASLWLQDVNTVQIWTEHQVAPGVRRVGAGGAARPPGWPGAAVRVADRLDPLESNSAVRQLRVELAVSS
jgi:hypothetical protein